MKTKLCRALCFLALLGGSFSGAQTSQSPLRAEHQTDRLPERNGRHALIIGISQYAATGFADLPGAMMDIESATQIARAMQVPTGNIYKLQNEQATGDGIRRALAALDARVHEGDRVFVHYSGHGTRYRSATTGGCVEALLAHEGGESGTITNKEMAELLRPITRKADKLFVMYDACHSGGVLQGASAARSRSVLNAPDEGQLRPKFAAVSEDCSRPANMRNSDLLVEQSQQGVLEQDVIHVSASRNNEVSFDDELKGGLATQFMRDCMLRDAQDLDGSGAITVEEVRVCAQEKLNRRLQNDAFFKPHHITLKGNTSFVPAWFSQPKGSSSPVSGEQALRQIYDQRDAKRAVKVALNKDRLNIGRDMLDLTVQTERSGYVYIVMAGSDNQTLTLLFPNDLDPNNRISAGQSVKLPRPGWRVKAAGPAGTDALLVLVTDSPRNLAALAARQSPNKGGPFVSSLNDAQGRAMLGNLMTSGVTAAECAKQGSACSDAYGASMVSVEEFN